MGKIKSIKFHVVVDINDIVHYVIPHGIDNFTVSHNKGPAYDEHARFKATDWVMSNYPTSSVHVRVVK